MEVVSETKVFGGRLVVGVHASEATGTPMRFSAFTPPGEGPFPVLIWLSGLTCTEENFTTKAGAYRAAAELGLIVVACDTSPRGESVPNFPAYDVGQGAGFYIDATEDPWRRHFQMESYVTKDLPAAVAENFPAADRIGVFGHSMGGHGALTLALRHPELFRSVSAFSPISSPTRCHWGEKAFAAYLGEERERWGEHDACLLLAAGQGAGRFDDILVDQGDADEFLERELKPELLQRAAADAGQTLTLRMQPGYDHSYFFVASFIEDHLRFHAERLAR